jgi:pyruvate dehydrogenase E1 component alpha subunit
MTQKEAEEIEAAAQREADEAVKFAVESPEPELSELMTDIYVPFAVTR